jgi:hypothetical protein
VGDKWGAPRLSGAGRVRGCAAGRVQPHTAPHRSTAAVIGGHARLRWPAASSTSRPTAWPMSAFVSALISCLTGSRGCIGGSFPVFGVVGSCGRGVVCSSRRGAGLDRSVDAQRGGPESSLGRQGAESPGCSVVVGAEGCRGRLGACDWAAVREPPEKPLKRRRATPLGKCVGCGGWRSGMRCGASVGAEGA